MKKLLLFIIVLFGCIGAISFAEPCSSAIWQCTGGTNITFGQYCPSVNTDNYSPSNYSEPPYVGAIAFDKNTGSGVAVSDSRNMDFAKDQVKWQCGKGCKIIPIKNLQCGVIAYSAQEKIMDSQTGYDSGSLMEKALEKCKKNGGKNCKIVINICNVKGEYRDFTF